MNRAIFGVLAASLSLSALVARSSEVTEPVHAHVPQTAAAVEFADVIARAERAITRQAASCASGAAPAADCEAFGGPGAQIANLWIFPTHDATSVFVHYEVRTSAGGEPQKQLALLEMSGEKIARLLNLGSAPAPQTLVAGD